MPSLREHWQLPRVTRAVSFTLEMLYPLSENTGCSTETLKLYPIPGYRGLLKCSKQLLHLKGHVESSFQRVPSARCPSASFTGPCWKCTCMRLSSPFGSADGLSTVNYTFPETGCTLFFFSCLQSKVDLVIKLVLCWLAVDLQACLELFKWVFFFVIKLTGGRKVQSNIKYQLLTL